VGAYVHLHVSVQFDLEITYILRIQLMWAAFQEKETELLNVFEGAESSTCVAGVEYWNEISVALYCRNAGVVFPLWLTVYGNYRSSANQAVTHLNSIASRRVWSDSERRAFLLKKKYINYGLECFTTSIRPLWRLQLPFRQGRPDFLFPKEWLSPCVDGVYVLWRY